MKKRLAVSMIGLLRGWSYGYFEDSYRCEKEQSSITVSLESGTMLCFELLENIQQDMEKLAANIKEAQGHRDRGRDPVYRDQVLTTLQKQYEKVARDQTYVRVAIQDYEHDLFVRIKSIVTFYLRPVYEEIVKKIEQADTLLIRTMLAGDTEQFAYITKKVEKLHQEAGILEQIKQADSFGELMPFLKQYLQDPSTGIIQVQSGLELTKESRNLIIKSPEPEGNGSSGGDAKVMLGRDDTLFK